MQLLRRIPWSGPFEKDARHPQAACQSIGATICFVMLICLKSILASPSIAERGRCLAAALLSNGAHRRAHLHQAGCPF